MVTIASRVGGSSNIYSRIIDHHDSKGLIIQEIEMDTFGHVKIVDLVVQHPDDPETPKTKDGKKWRNDFFPALKSSFFSAEASNPCKVGKFITGMSTSTFSHQICGEFRDTVVMDRDRETFLHWSSRHFLRVSRARSQLQVHGEWEKWEFFVDK